MLSYLEYAPEGGFALYKALLFLHVIGVIALGGPLFLLPVLARLRGDPPSVAVLKIEATIERFVALFFVWTLVTGIGLISESPFVKHRFGHAHWLHVSLALFVIAGGLATGFSGARRFKALAAAGKGDTAAAKKLLAPADTIGVPLVAVLVAVITYLMLIKP